MKSAFSESLTDEFLDTKRTRTDPGADRVIGQVVATHGREKAKKIFDTLIREVELPLDSLPGEIKSFINKNNTLPAWADSKQVRLAQDLFIDHGPKLLMILYFKSLPILYSMKNGARVLVKTGRLAHDPESSSIFTRRIAETGQFLLQVMCPDGLEHRKIAIEACLKVRLIHASIRHFIPTDQWNEAMWGKPVNQEDLAATLMTFSISLTDGLKQFNIRISREEEQAYLHCWRVTGHLMGIDDDLLPETPEEARFLLERILERQSAGSEEGKILTSALVRFVDEQIDSSILSASPRILIRHLAGVTIAERVGVRKGRFWWFHILLPAILKAFFSVGEKLEDRVGVLEKFTDKASHKILHKMVGYFDEYKQTHFTVPDSLKKEWQV